ncbi:MAG: TspO/MBR family protein [Candidatus Margulisiibacteriota bacterium]
MNIIKLVVSIGICLLAGGIGSIATYPSIPTWYAGLNRPALSPPNWIFGPVWTTLFIMMGIALYLVWQKGTEKKEIRNAMVIFGVQLILNTFWSILFFGMQRPLYSFIEIIFLWLAILATIISFSKISKPAAWLLVPYILWVSFASYLNLTIYLVNR